MHDDLPDVPALRVLEPPRGGLAVLRERLATPRRQRWWWLAVPALAAAMVLLVVARRPPQPPDAPAPVANAVLEHGVYWVASTPGPQRMPSAPPPQVVSIEQLAPIVERAP